jgi:uncharacterized protein (TIGR03435 family)
MTEKMIGHRAYLLTLMGGLVMLAAVRLAGGQAGTLVPGELAFEVTSVKRLPPAGDGPLMVRLGGIDGNRWIAQNVTLGMLIRSAYGQRFGLEGQIVGGPSWIQSDRFDVTGVAAAIPTRDESQQMLQRLLADRFKLVVHTEQREMPVYALKVADGRGKLGRDLKATNVDCQALQAEQKRTGVRAPPPAPRKAGDAAAPCSNFVMMGGTTMILENGAATMAQLSSSLSGPVGRPVIDRTGLAGYFAYRVEFAREPGTPGLLGGPPTPMPPGAAGAAAPGDQPSVFSAVQEQLGLKLEPTREPVDVLVIDSAQPPTED